MIEGWVELTKNFSSDQKKKLQPQKSQVAIAGTLQTVYN